MEDDGEEMEDDEPFLSEERLRMWERQQETHVMEFVVDDCTRNLIQPTLSSQGQSTADLEVLAQVSNHKQEQNSFARFLEIRMQETEYTDEELKLMYQMHNQSFYMRDNFQNPKTIEECYCASTGLQGTVKLKKRLYSALDDQQKQTFDEIRDELDKDGLMFVSNNQVMRAMTSCPEKSQCVLQIKKVIELRSQMQLNDIQESEFQDLIQMQCVIDRGSYDREGRPIQFLLLRNMNLKKVSVEQFSRYCVFEGDRAARRARPCTDEIMVVVDFQGFGFSQMYMSHIKAAASLIQDLNCGRCSHTKIVNGGKFLSSVQSLFSRFFTESAKENFDIMGDDFKQKLAQYVSADNLPIEYGGTMPSLKS